MRDCVDCFRCGIYDWFIDILIDIHKALDDCPTLFILLGFDLVFDDMRYGSCTVNDIFSNISVNA